MSILSGATTRLAPAPDSMDKAYLVRLPQQVLARLGPIHESGTDPITISVGDSTMVSISLSYLTDHQRLNVPGFGPVALEELSTGTPSEIYTLPSGSSSSQTLHPVAVASSRLNVPLSSANAFGAGDKLREQNAATDQLRKDRADRVNGVKKARPQDGTSSSISMARAVSSPVTSLNPSLSDAPAGAKAPVVPLKTRVIQLLALGPRNMQDIVDRVEMHESDVTRVVKVVSF